MSEVKENFWSDPISLIAYLMEGFMPVVQLNVPEDIVNQINLTTAATL